MIRIDNHISEQVKTGLFKSAGFISREECLFSREKKGSHQPSWQGFGPMLCAVLVAFAVECVIGPGVFHCEGSETSEGLYHLELVLVEKCCWPWDPFELKIFLIGHFPNWNIWQRRQPPSGSVPEGLLPP